MWMSRKYGADSSLSQLIVQVRQASQVDEAQEGVSKNTRVYYSILSYIIQYSLIYDNIQTTII